MRRSHLSSKTTSSCAEFQKVEGALGTYWFIQWSYRNPQSGFEKDAKEWQNLNLLNLNKRKVVFQKGRAMVEMFTLS